MLFQHYVGKTTYTIKPVQITLLPHHDISRHIVYTYIYIFIFIYLFVFIFYIHSFWHSIWHLFWHSIWHSLKRKWTGRGQVRVRQGPLLSRACSWGPAGATLILGLLFESGRTTAISHLQLIDKDHAVWSGACCSGLRGPLRSRACSWGPAGNTLILGLVVRSSACSWGQAEKGEGEGGGQLT